MANTLIPLALHIPTNRHVFVDDVDSGLACNCVCIGCGEQLQANKGKVRAHYFSHKPKSVDDEKPCPFTFERCLFWMCREILDSAETLALPQYNIEYAGKTEMVTAQNTVTIDAKSVFYPNGLENTYGYDKAVCRVRGYGLAIKLHFSSVCPPHNIWDTRQPYIHTDEELPLVAFDLSAIKHELLKCRSGFKSALEVMLLKGIEHKKWLFHPKEDLQRVKYKAAKEASDREVAHKKALHQAYLSQQAKSKKTTAVPERVITPINNRVVTGEDEIERLSDLVNHAKSFKDAGNIEANLCRECFFLTDISSSQCSFCGKDTFQQVELDQNYFNSIEAKYRSKGYALMSAKKFLGPIQTK